MKDTVGIITNAKEAEDKEMAGTTMLHNTWQLEVATADQVDLNNRDDRILQATSKK